MFHDFNFFLRRVIDSTTTLEILGASIRDFSRISAPSGAFFSLRCLIYKVHAPCGTFTMLPQLPAFVKRFFHFFRGLFSAAPLNPRPVPRDSSLILLHHAPFVKYFFSPLRNLFSFRCSGYPPRQKSPDSFASLQASTVNRLPPASVPGSHRRAPSDSLCRLPHTFPLVNPLSKKNFAHGGLPDETGLFTVRTIQTFSLWTGDQNASGIRSHGFDLLLL